MVRLNFLSFARSISDESRNSNLVLEAQVQQLKIVFLSVSVIFF